MVALSGDYAPPATPVVSAERTRRRTAILWLLGLVTFAALSVLPGAAPREVDGDREIHHDRELPPSDAPPTRMLMGVGR